MADQGRPRPKTGDLDPSDDLFDETRATLPAYLRRPRLDDAPPAPQDRELFPAAAPRTIEVTDAPSSGAAALLRRDGDPDRHDPGQAFPGDLLDLLDLLEKRIEELDGRIDTLPERLDERLDAALAPLLSRFDRIERALAAGGPAPDGVPAFGSALAGLPGIGPARIRALEDRFGDLRRLADASLPEVCELPGIGPDLAEQLITTAWAATH